MADFLSHLAQQSSGRFADIRPLIPPLFAPAASLPGQPLSRSYLSLLPATIGPDLSSEAAAFPPEPPGDFALPVDLVPEHLRRVPLPLSLLRNLPSERDVVQSDNDALAQDAVYEEEGEEPAPHRQDAGTPEGRDIDSSRNQNRSDVSRSLAAGSHPVRSSRQPLPFPDDSTGDDERAKAGPSVGKQGSADQAGDSGRHQRGLSTENPYPGDPARDNKVIQRREDMHSIEATAAPSQISPSPGDAANDDIRAQSHPSPDPDASAPTDARMKPGKSYYGLPAREPTLPPRQRLPPSGAPIGEDRGDPAIPASGQPLSGNSARAGSVAGRKAPIDGGRDSATTAAPFQMSPTPGDAPDDGARTPSHASPGSYTASATPLDRPSGSIDGSSGRSDGAMLDQAALVEAPMISGTSHIGIPARRTPLTPRQPLPLSADPAGEGGHDTSRLYTGRPYPGDSPRDSSATRRRGHIDGIRERNGVAAHYQISPAHMDEYDAVAVSVSRTEQQHTIVPHIEGIENEHQQEVATQQPVEAGPPVPIIRVRIGRVEVRVTAPESTPPSRSTRASRPGMTLSEYIQQRKEHLH